MNHKQLNKFAYSRP